MKWIIASDIHGSARWTKALLAAWDRENAGRLLLLGDILYHGPRNALPEEYDPQRVLALLNERRESILSVRGNCDAEVDQMVLGFPVLAEYALLFAGERMIFATHGHIYKEEHLPPLHRGDILLHGHTHIPAWEERETYYYFNPGSAALPKAGAPHSYMTLEDGLFLWKDMDGRELQRLRA